MKKLTFLFIIIFIIALALGGYFIVQEVRGKVITITNSNLDLGETHTITGIFASPSSGEYHVVTKNYLGNVDELSLPEGGTWYSLSSWCEVQYFDWCSAGYPPPPPPGPECGDGDCDPGEDEFSCPEDCGCFAAETQILMADNSHKPIKEVKEGDWILTKENESSDKMVSAKVAKTSEQTVKGYLVINNKLKVTGNHPIFVKGNWKPARSIELGDKLLNEKGQEVVVESLELKRETIKAYNIELEDSQAYFAGGFYVHNVLKNGEPPLP